MVISVVISASFVVDFSDFGVILVNRLTTAIHVVRIRVRVTSDRSPCFLVQTSDYFESLCIFTKSIYCVSLPMKHKLEMLREIKEIAYKHNIVKMHKIT